MLPLVNKGQNGVQRGLIRGSVLVAIGAPFYLAAILVSPLLDRDSAWGWVIALPGIVLIPVGLLVVAFYAAVWVVKVGASAVRD